MDKIFSTTNKQLRQLRARGMVISNGSRAKRIIEMENYYRNEKPREIKAKSGRM